MAGDQVLSQADIDALLSGRPAAAPAPVQAAPPPPAAAAPAVVPTDALRATVDQLGARVRYLEEAVARLSSQPGTEAGAPGEMVLQLQQQLQVLNATVSSIMAAMQNTVGFRAHETFVCSGCNTQGLVAARLNCTACGQENWWGWFPPQPPQ